MIPSEIAMMYIVIPAYNEEQVIAEVLRGLRDAGYARVIVVDDGSTDNTGLAARSAGAAVVLQHFLNRGKGAAAKTGIEAAKRLGADTVVTMDGDGQHDPADIARMLRLLDEGWEVVLGSRLKDPRGMPRWKILANVAGNLITWALYGLWVTDSQSGFRAYSRKALDLIDTRTDRYEYDSEVIREIGRHRLKFIEIPITVIYTEYSMGKANKQGFTNGLKTIFRMMRST
jgi:glycosyltransferase involved in cell wall biosynthesis